MSDNAHLLVEYVKNVTIVTFNDSSVLEARHIDAIREQLLHMVDAEFKNRLVLDLSKVHHFSSTALGVLITVLRRVKDHKGALVLCGVRDDIYRVFKVTKLHKQFTFADNEKKALAALHVHL